MENSKNSTGLKVALGIAIVLFLGTGFYTMNLYSSSKKVQGDLTEQAEWYLSLAYLKNKDMEKSKTILKRIIVNNSIYKEQSESLLDSLN